MTNKFKPGQLLSTITLPPQEQTKLSFCNSNKVSAVKAWLNNLQATKVLHTSSQLYNALPEIARLKTDYQHRMEMLESLRPSVQYCILGLQKSFLNQPLIMPKEAQKSVVVAQSLQKYMIDAYIVTVMQISQGGKANKSTLNILAQAIHRAITGIGLLFFRNYQIYSQPPANLWSTLNILYLVAYFYDLTSTPIADPNLKNTRAMTIEAAYARILLLDTAKTNQMSQTDVEAVFNILENWCQTVKLTPNLSDDTEIQHAVNLLSSQGPIYKSKISDKAKGQYLEIDLKVLLGQLSKQSSAIDDTIENHQTNFLPKDFSSSLLNHLVETWGDRAERKYNRRTTDATAEVCVGLIDCHYLVCNGQDFEYFLSSSDNYESQQISRFSQGLTPASHMNDKNAAQGAPTYSVLTQNVSSGGYCLLWQGEISPKVSAGELIGIKETGKRTWSLGAIRWVRQLKNASQIGIQLLASTPKPYGIAQANDMGGFSEYTRAFFLPPTRFAQNTPTILCTSAPYTEFDKVQVIDGERKWSTKLDNCIFSTKSIQQFTFRNLDDSDDQTNDNRRTTPNENFDSQWD